MLLVTMMEEVIWQPGSNMLKIPALLNYWMKGRVVIYLIPSEVAEIAPVKLFIEEPDM